MSRIVASLLVIAVPFCLGQPTAKQQPASSLVGYELAFVRGKDIWIARGDGTNQRRLIAHGWSPSWSPDGKKVAFYRHFDLWMADADGTHQVRLTRRYTGKGVRSWYEDADCISWCPTAPRITVPAAVCLQLRNQRPDQRQQLCGTAIADVFTGEPRGGVQYTYVGPTDTGAGFAFSENCSPAWSRSGRWLAFARNGDVWVAYFSAENTRYQDVNGALTDKREKTRTWDWTASRIAAPASFDEPTWRASREIHGVTHMDWSPDERHLVYGMTREGGTGTEEVHVLDLAPNKEDTSSGLRVLRDRRLPDGMDPAFTPDGRCVTVSTQREDGSGWHLWLIDLNGKSKRLLLRNGEEPAWRPVARSSTWLLQPGKNGG